MASQVRGTVSREVSAVSPGKVLRNVQGVIDQKTGGILSSLGIIKGSKGESGALEGIVSGGSGQLSTLPSLSQWGGMSEHLFGVFFPVTADGVEITSTEGLSSQIYGPVTDVQFESVLTWQSPFENSGPESKAPTIMALLQTGQLAVVANSLQLALPDGAVGNFARDLAGKAQTWAKSLEGRTGITKLNSRQVFSGMPPVRLTMVLHLRAVSDPDTEVVQPYQQLLEWSWPQQLAENGIFSEVLTSDEGFLHAMFPSKAPQMIGFRYGNNRYSPMVVESVGNPLDGPMDSRGRPISRSIQLTLATLTALDKDDVQAIFSRS